MKIKGLKSDDIWEEITEDLSELDDTGYLVEWGLEDGKNKSVKRTVKKSDDESEDK